MNTSVRSKLAWAFGLLALIVLVVSGFAFKELKDANDEFENFVSGINARLAVANEVINAVNARAVAARNIVLLTKPEELAVENEAATRAHAKVGERLAKLKQMAETSKNVSAQAKQLIAEVDKIEQRYAPVALSVIDLGMKRQSEQAIAKINDECRPLLASLIKALNKYFEYSENVQGNLLKETRAKFALQQTLLSGVAILAIAIAVVAGFFISRSILSTLGTEPAELSDAVGKVADGDLTATMQVRAGDTKSVLAAVARMQASLIDVVSSVRQGSEGVANASTEISQGNHDLSGRTESQASALQQTAASMEQLGATVKQNADNAKQANQLAVKASSVAVQGGEVVNEVVNTMKGINESSRKIEQIIAVIDGIAFQTNILALNAAVEAARAGEQGRGFAVVAGEVRSLAQRSGQAAKEIKDLINVSVARVEEGTQLVDKAGETMTEIVASVRRVTDIIGEISAASDEQAHGVGQVATAVSQMDQVTQQNAALVEEMAAAASSLNTQAQDLVRTVAIFKVSGLKDVGTLNGGPGGVRVNKPVGSVPSVVTSNPSQRQKSRSPMAKTIAAPTRPEKRAEKSADSSAMKPSSTAPAVNEQDWESF